MNGPKKNEIIELTIESLAFGGKAVAHWNGFTIFIDRGLPGQIVKAKLTRKKSNYAEAHVVDMVTSSPFEVTPRCSHFGVCGGCRFQNLAYSEQLVQKQRQVKETLEHVGGLWGLEIQPILASPEIYFYRNKMEFSFANQRWLTPDEIKSNQRLDPHFALGLHIVGQYDKVLNIDRCFLLSDRSNEILRLVRDLTMNSKLLPYTTIDHTGFWRFLVIRESKRLDQTMVNLVTADHPEGSKVVQSITQQLVQEFPFISTIVHNISRKKAQIAFGDEQHVIFGDGFIIESLGTKNYRISANSFFQTNSLQTEKLYQTVKDWGQFQTDQIVYDLYSGTGGIGIYIADQVKKVVGFELIPQAINDARINCQMNNIDNCHFIQGDLKEKLAHPGQVLEQFGQPAVVIIDPPRSGLHPKLPEKIQTLHPEKIIYISCNPATLARDLKLLCENSTFSPRLVQPIDMFPHTPHCEVMVLLQ